MSRRSGSIGRVAARLGLASLCLVALGATNAAAQTAPDSIYDPWRPLNHGLFVFGRGLDQVTLAPIAHGYMRITPTYVQHRVSSGVFNLGEPSTAIEDVLQGRPRKAGEATARFVVNSTVGVLGMFDVASRWGLAPHVSDFGQTLGRYGAQPGPYIFVPLIGPSDLRDGIGRIVDVVADPIGFVTGPITSPSGGVHWGVTALEIRIQSDPAIEALKDAIDPYVTARSAYMQHRDAVVREATGEPQALPDFN